MTVVFIQSINEHLQSVFVLLFVVTEADEIINSTIESKCIYILYVQ